MRKSPGLNPHERKNKKDWKMAHITFCATAAGMNRQIAARQAADGADPFVLRKGSDIPEAIHALQSDRNVVANAFAAAFGERDG